MAPQRRKEYLAEIQYMAGELKTRPFEGRVFLLAASSVQLTLRDIIEEICNFPVSIFK